MQRRVQRLPVHPPGQRPPLALQESRVRTTPPYPLGMAPQQGQALSNTLGPAAPSRMLLEFQAPLTPEAHSYATTEPHRGRQQAQGHAILGPDTWRLVSRADAEPRLTIGSGRPAAS